MYFVLYREMALTVAEISRRYRERKKQKDPKYMERERLRKRQAYVPVHLLNATQLKERRKSVRKRVKKHDERKKAHRYNQPECTQSKPNTRSTGGKLVAKALEFRGKSRNEFLRKRKSSALKVAYREIQDLKQKNTKLQKEKKTIQRKCQRQTKARNSNTVPLSSGTTGSSNSDSNLDVTSSTPSNPANETPDSKTNREIREQGLSPKQHSSIKKKLLFTNVINDRKELCEKLLEKYRCVATAKRTFGKSWKKRLGIMVRMQERKKSAEWRATKKNVKEFLERDDNSSVMPGKKDCMSDKNRTQKRVLNDYLHNLHQKFLMENPDTTLSRSSFCKMRPKHVLLANFCNRQTCLCSRHQNLALKLRSHP